MCGDEFGSTRLWSSFVDRGLFHVYGRCGGKDLFIAVVPRAFNVLIRFHYFEIVHFFSN